MHKFNYILNTQQLCVAIKLRYACSIPGLPVSCLCEEDFIVQYAMPSKKGEYLSWDTKKWEITATLLYQMFVEMSNYSNPIWH